MHQLVARRIKKDCALTATLTFCAVVTLRKLSCSHLEKLTDNNSNMNLEDKKRPSDNKEIDNEYK